MKRLLAPALLAACSLCGPAIADVALSLVPPAQGQILEGEIRFDLLGLNADSSADSFAAPTTLPCRLTTTEGVVDATATRVSSESTVSIAAGGFARATYVVKLSTVGRVVIELTDRAAATVVTIAPPGAPAVATAPAKPRNPLEMVTQPDPNFRSEAGLVEYLAYRVKPHEPVYIVAGNAEPSTKFQLSFKYQIFDPNGAIAQKVPVIGGLYFGYSQTSLWDLGNEDESNPFRDSSYRPELLVSYESVDRFLRREDENGNVSGLPDWVKLGFQAGVKHESNGRSFPESRSVNIVYARPIITFTARDGLFLTLAPTVWASIADVSDNPDIEDYRGYGDLRVVMGQAGGVQLAAIGRMGDTGDNRSLQLDLSFPIRQLSSGNLDVYFHTQYFMGYGESLLRYDTTDYSLRFGISLVR
jgi:phospholipase A1/A2